MARHLPTRAGARFAALSLALALAAGTIVTSAAPAGAQTGPHRFLYPCPVSISPDPYIVWSFAGNMTGTTRFGNYQAPATANFCGAFPQRPTENWETSIQPTQIFFGTSTIPFGGSAFTTKLQPVGNLRLRYSIIGPPRFLSLDGQFQVQITWPGGTCYTGSFYADLFAVLQPNGTFYGLGPANASNFAVPAVTPSATCPQDHANWINWIGGLPAAPGASYMSYTLDMRNRT
jgi:hypothetical protein